MSTTSSPSGMRHFMIIWGGQLISVLGSWLTAFALSVWVYEKTGSAMAFALGLLANTLPATLITPLAGAITDRYNRRTLMMLADLGAGMSTLAIFILATAGLLDLWHVYLATFVNSLCSTLHGLAYTASISLLVEKKHYGRANGMVQIVEAATGILGPALAGSLYALAGLQPILMIDLATFAFAVSMMLFFVHIPTPVTSAEAQTARGSLWSEISYGWRYISQRPGLNAMLFYFAFVNFSFGMLMPLMGPLLIETYSTATFGWAQSLLSAAMLIGAIAASSWAGPKRRMVAVYGAIMLMGAGMVVMGLARSLPVFLAGLAGMVFVMPTGSAASQTIWQSKVPADVQGRVFGVRRMLSGLTHPLAILLAGPLTDSVFKPLMAEGGLWNSGLIGQVVGVGATRGIHLMFVLLGLMVIAGSALAMAFRPLRQVENDLLDAEIRLEPETDVLSKTVPASAAQA